MGIAKKQKPARKPGRSQSKNDVFKIDVLKKGMVPRRRLVRAFATREGLDGPVKWTVYWYEFGTGIGDKQLFYTTHQFSQEGFEARFTPAPPRPDTYFDMALEVRVFVFPKEPKTVVENDGTTVIWRGRKGDVVVELDNQGSPSYVGMPRKLVEQHFLPEMPEPRRTRPRRR